MGKYDQTELDIGTSLLIETLETRWKTYRKVLKVCQKEPKEVAIHDLRIATRRLLAMANMLRGLTPHPRLQKLRRALKNQLDSLDDLRDTQVMLVEVSEVINDLPELARFHEYLTKREKRLLRSTAKAIRTFKLPKVKKRIDATRKALTEKNDSSEWRNALLFIVDDAYHSTLRRYHRIEPLEPATIHRVRIAFKEFRYMVEIIYPLIENFPDENFKYMHDFQDAMGDIQDLEVFLSTFENLSKNDTSYDPKRIHEFYKQRHTEFINSFVKDMNQINIFWRPSSDAKFPWETRKKKISKTRVK